MVDKLGEEISIMFNKLCVYDDTVRQKYYVTSLAQQDAIQIARIKRNMRFKMLVQQLQNPARKHNINDIINEHKAMKC